MTPSGVLAVVVAVKLAGDALAEVVDVFLGQLLPVVRVAILRDRVRDVEQAEDPDDRGDDRVALSEEQERSRGRAHSGEHVDARVGVALQVPREERQLLVSAVGRFSVPPPRRAAAPRRCVPDHYDHSCARILTA